MMHADAGSSTFSMHCPHASRSSTPDTCNDTATPNMANYCSFVTTFCTDENALFENNDVASCMTEMGSQTPMPYMEGPYPTFEDSSGATVGCLNYWAYQTALDSANCAKADWRIENWLTNGGTGVCHP